MGRLDTLVGIVSNSLTLLLLLGNSRTLKRRVGKNPFYRFIRSNYTPSGLT